MALNAYDPCPCGSGKKFKWCCQEYFHHIEAAFDLQQREQHANAVREMEALVAKHPDKPQVYGFFANLYLGEDKPEKAEEMLDKAFQIDPQFPMGFLLRGLMRQNEGEYLGALLLFRKASEAFSTEATTQLAQVNEFIARLEVMLNRPLASRAAMARAVFYAPNDLELRQQFETIFGEESRLPASAGKAYTFRKTAKPIPEEAITGKLSDAKKAFDQVTQLVPEDPAGWFNLGLVRAWLGEQPQALEAFNKSIELEWDDTKAAEAASICEVLRCAQGMEGDSDYIEYRAFMPVRDPEALFSFLQAMAQARLILAPQMNEDQTIFTCIMIEEIPSLLDTGNTVAKAMANVSIAGGVIRIWNVDQLNVQKVAQMLRDRLALAVGEPTFASGVCQFMDILQGAIAYPTRTVDAATIEKRIVEYAQNYFETIWAHKPLKSLNNVAPIDAVGSKLLRKKLLGLVKFLEEIMLGLSPRRRMPDGSIQPMVIYDFNLLRHKLGIEVLASGEAPTIHVPETPIVVGEPKPAPPPKLDFGAMNAAELAGVNLDPLTIGEIEEGMRAALKLDAKEIAVKYARSGVAKPYDTARPDRYPIYAVAITGAIADGNYDLAIQTVSQGMTDDGYQSPSVGPYRQDRRRRERVRCPAGETAR
jgi:tetratricopeptide (TPR) repeat protein